MDIHESLQNIIKNLAVEFFKNSPENSRFREDLLFHVQFANLCELADSHATKETEISSNLASTIDTLNMCVRLVFSNANQSDTDNHMNNVIKFIKELVKWKNENLKI